MAALIPPHLVLGFLNLQGIVFFGMYVVGIVAALLMAWIFKKILSSREPSYFFLELPPYRMPYWRSLLVHVWERSGVFVKKAGTLILLLCIALWVGCSFPRDTAVSRGKNQTLQNSYAGRVGLFMEPWLKPLGFDWKIDVGLLTSFAQREVFVSTLAILNNLGEEKDAAQSLKQAMRRAKDPVSGRPLYPPLVGLSILVFFAFACQCVSTLVVAYYETGTWRWPAFMFVYMMVLAYAASLVVYQGGKYLGF